MTVETILGYPNLCSLSPVTLLIPWKQAKTPSLLLLRSVLGQITKATAFEQTRQCRGKSDGSLLTPVQVVHLHSMRLYVSRFRNLWEGQIYLLRCSQAIARIGHAFKLMDAYYRVIAETLLGLCRCGSKSLLPVALCSQNLSLTTRHLRRGLPLC